MSRPTPRRLKRRVLLVFTALSLLLGALPALAQFSPGPLSRAHQDLEGTRRCTSCHEVGGAKGASDGRCLDCHKALKSRIAAGQGFHARGGRDRGCGGCHAEHHGRDFDLMGLDRAAFDHRETGYVLNGRHAALACEKCHHAPRSFLGATSTCNGCHDDPHHAALGSECVKCHDENAWKPASGFDHARTRFALTGRHVQVACDKCHAGGRLTGLRFESCADCHRSPHAEGFSAGRTCASCHSTDGWSAGSASSFDHGKTGFPLAGAHARAGCAACHSGGRFGALAGASCEACHRDPHAKQFADRPRVDAPGERAGRAPSTCAGCHDEASWKPASLFDHAATRYPLTGGHLRAKCERCHAQGRYVGTTTTCSACHADEHRGELGSDCARCHGSDAWQTVSFRHETTRFPLAGRHAQAACRSCHGSGSGARYADLDRTCASCHADPHRGQFTAHYPSAASPAAAVQPPAATPADSAFFAVHGRDAKMTACSDCHAPAAWRPSQYDHAKSDFPLTGAHVRVPCGKCHANGAYAGVTTTCVGCHADPHQGQFATSACTDCHESSEWKKVRFDHRGTTFALSGRHKDLACSACHEEGRFRGLSPQCASCHEDTHLRALGASCDRCHTSEAWTPSSFAHGIDLFPAWGAHEAVDCAACHRDEVTWQVDAPPRQCIDCHDADFRRASVAVHAQAGPDCERCHEWDAWRPAHDDAWFNIRSGPHRGVACSRCHDLAPNDYSSFTCVSCHPGGVPR